jgi:flagellar basal-body rod protein FlgG
VQVLRSGEVYVSLPGQEEPELVGEIEIASFINPAGLKQVGENLFVETAASGPPLAGEPDLDGRGGIESGRLEGSNVDPTMELISLIRTQRAFEMNSQTIRAADETLQSVSQLRR